jgi:flagellar basal body rod protein FlgB
MATQRTISCPFTGNTVETTDETLQDSFNEIMFQVKVTQAKRALRAAGCPAAAIDAIEFAPSFS